jgi:hypothetical protein
MKQRRCEKKEMQGRRLKQRSLAHPLKQTSRDHLLDRDHWRRERLWDRHHQQQARPQVQLHQFATPPHH